eukprot:TRINITY_DN23291_c0_g1_i1.p3 TRINITY_DN23291_c0_g1~~TRINITY_DN23291_c0_g1_i1.p3  ORF type:complete len:110 (+),score=11.55 TRINITY_DN23291_c0_g1_i1:291-620(+)
MHLRLYGPFLASILRTTSQRRGFCTPASPNLPHIGRFHSARLHPAAKSRTPFLAIQVSGRHEFSLCGHFHLRRLHLAAKSRTPFLAIRVSGQCFEQRPSLWTTIVHELH